MGTHHPEISASTIALEQDLNIESAAPPILDPNASEFELAVLGAEEIPADIVSGIKPRSKIRVAAILVALNVRIVVCC
jgi:hypothetical protein